MAAVSTSSQTVIDIASITPFRPDPIRVVPKYLFETCYRARKTYDSRYLGLLRAKAQTITLSEIKGFSIENAAKVKRAKEFDWVYGLDRLEIEFLQTDGMMQKTALKVEDIVRINKYFSRFIHEKRLRNETRRDCFAGQFRKELFRFSIANFTPTEAIALHFIEEKIRKSHSKAQLASISDPTIKINPCIVPKNWLRNKLTFHIARSRNSSSSSASSSASFPFAIDVDMVDKWADANGEIDLIKWLQQRMHYCPAPSQIKSNLQKVLDAINSSSMHPIEKAARILFEIAKINVFEDDNIETGVAIVSAILLHHGYLPPVIEDKDYEEFTNCITKHLNKKDGHTHLQNFIAKLIQEAQKKFKSDSRDIKEFSVDEKK